MSQHQHQQQFIFPLTPQQFAMNNNILQSTINPTDNPQPQHPYNTDANAMQGPTFILPQPQSNGTFSTLPDWRDNAMHSDNISLLDLTDPDAIISSADGDDTDGPEEIDRTRTNINAFLVWVSCIKTGTGAMPMPSSQHAPQFCRHDLWEFLVNYNSVAKSTGWTDAQKCKNIHNYCDRCS